MKFKRYCSMCASYNVCQERRKLSDEPTECIFFKFKWYSPTLAAEILINWFTRSKK